MSRKSIIVGLCGIVLLLAVGFGIWTIYGSGNGEGRSFQDNTPPEVRAVQERAFAIALKDSAPETLTSQDWAYTKEMLASPHWAVRTKGLINLAVFKDTGYAPQAWQLALDHLTDAEPAPRTHAANAAAVLRPEEAARHIAPLLQDPDKDTRDAVKRVLTRLGYSTK